MTAMETGELDWVWCEYILAWTENSYTTQETWRGVRLREQYLQAGDLTAELRETPGKMLREVYMTEHCHDAHAPSPDHSEQCQTGQAQQLGAQARNHFLSTQL